MKTLLGLVLLIGGVFVGLYAGAWWGFIGGIVQIIDAIKVSPVQSMDIATGIARIVFAGPIGWISLFIVSGTGWAMLFSE